MTDLETLREIFDRANFDPETLTYNGSDHFLLVNDQLQFTFNTDGSLSNYHILPFNDKLNDDARKGIRQPVGGLFKNRITKQSNSNDKV